LKQQVFFDDMPRYRRFSGGSRRKTRQSGVKRECCRFGFPEEQAKVTFKILKPSLEAAEAARSSDMTTEQLEAQKAHLAGQQIAYRWMKRHILDFAQSAENSRKLGDYLTEHNLELSELNLEKAFTELRGKGISFTSGVPAPATAAADELPVVPSYFPKMESKKDIDAIPREKFRELYFGKHNQLFKKRIEAITKRGL
jgi:hypothetical protein